MDELLAADIQPWVTLFHRDLPQALEDRFQRHSDSRISFPDVDFVQPEREGEASQAGQPASSPSP